MYYKVGVLTGIQFIIASFKLKFVLDNQSILLFSQIESHFSKGIWIRHTPFGILILVCVVHTTLGNLASLGFDFLICKVKRMAILPNRFVVGIS